MLPVISPPARKIWEAIPGDIRLRILNNVYCVGCSETTGIGNISGKKEKGMLVLRGVCTRCGGPACPVKFLPYEMFTSLNAGPVQLVHFSIASG